MKLEKLYKVDDPERTFNNGTCDTLPMGKWRIKERHMVNFKVK